LDGAAGSRADLGRERALRRCNAPRHPTGEARSLNSPRFRLENSVVVNPAIKGVNVYNQPEPSSDLLSDQNGTG
jgi:hypothetical protein